jgi:hypothetical protein
MVPVFLEKLFSFLFKTKSSRTLKKKTMRQLVKELSRNRYAHFYQPKTGILEPAMAAFFFELYRTVSRARVFLDKAADSELLKELTMETFLDIEYLDARQRLTAEYVKAQVKIMPVAEVSRLLQEDFNFLASGIDNKLAAEVDWCYNQILALIHFSAFDFFFLLKKFDHSLVENNFNIQPRFSPVAGRALREQIKDFLDLFYALNTKLDWGPPLRVLKLYKNGVDVFDPEEWDTLIGHLRELGQSNILLLIIRHLEEDPSWQLKPVIDSEYIAANYLEAREKEVREAMNSIVREQKLLRVRDLAQNVFGNSDVRQAAHYSPEENSVFVNRGLDGYIYAEGFSYTKAFLLGIFKKEMQNLCELLLIRGHWCSMEFSQTMSENYYILVDTAIRIGILDDSLGENGENGSRMRAMLTKCERDKIQMRNLKAVLKDVNRQARELINTSTQALLVIGTILENVLEDQKSGAGEFIINWKELESAVEIPLVKHLIVTHQQISGFLRMLQLLEI